MLAQGYGFWHRISIAHSCFNQKKSTRPPLLQCLVHSDHGAVFIDKPGSPPPYTTAWDSSIAVQLRELRSAVAVKPKRSAVNNTSSDSTAAGDGRPLNKAGLTSGNRLPCQNDNQFLITECS